MAPPLDTLSLSQLLDLAIGMPNNGAVHFAALRKLLQAMLGHLDGQYLTTQEPWTGEMSGPSLAELASDVNEMKNQMECYRKFIPEALQGESAARSKGSSQGQEAQSRMQQDMQKFLEEQNEAMADSQNLRGEIAILKAEQFRISQKMKEVLTTIKKLEEEIAQLREEIEKWKETSEQITQQMESVLQETKSELKKMEEQQEMKNTMLEQLVTEATSQMQEKMGVLEEIVGTVQEEQEIAKAACSNCSFDVKALLGELLQRCEKLQEEVDSLESRQTTVGKMENIIKERKQDKELLQRMELRVSKIQGDCEELNFLSGSLQKDCEQKQKDIETLFQSLETMKKDKADEEHVVAAMDVKADKVALSSKVSCSQFESSMERLEERMQKMQSQVLGQNQHWNEVQQQLIDEMENKLDRQEMMAFHEQMEETWQKSLEEMETKMAETDGAAGMRKQLPVPFSCLSCDRMVQTHVPGPYLQTLPYLQPLPPIKDSQHGQRKTVVSGRVSQSPPNSRDHPSSSCSMQHTQASPRSKLRQQNLMILPNKPSISRLLGSGGHVFRGQEDLPRLMDRAEDEPCPATSQEPQPATTHRHVSWAPELVQILQPRQTM